MGDVVPFPRRHVRPMDPRQLQQSLRGGHALDLVETPWPTDDPADTPLVAFVRRHQRRLAFACILAGVFAGSWFAAACTMGAGQW